MKKLNTARFATAALLGGLAWAAHAAWTFTGTNGGAPSTGYTDAGITLSISGVAATNGVTTLAADGTNSATLNSGFNSTAKWFDASSSLLYFSGVGLAMASDGTSSPNHAFDNAGLNTEGLLLQFGSSVTLKTFTTGYVSGDSDFSVLRYTGSGTPTTALFNTLASQTANSATSGWELVGNYNGGSAAGSTVINAGNVGSSWWLVTAYNASFGGASGTLDQGNDFFKIYSVAGSACTTAGSACNLPSGASNSTPEPGSLALVVAAGLGAAFVRRHLRLR